MLDKKRVRCLQEALKAATTAPGSHPGVGDSCQPRDGKQQRCCREVFTATCVCTSVELGASHRRRRSSWWTQLLWGKQRSGGRQSHLQAEESQLFTQRVLRWKMLRSDKKEKERNPPKSLLFPSINHKNTCKKKILSKRSSFLSHGARIMQEMVAGGRWWCLLNILLL